MTLIKLKDDAVTRVLPLYSSVYTEGEYVGDCYMYGGTDTSFDVRIEFDNSSLFNYHTERSLIDEESVSETISYLFSDTSKFSELTAEEFKENLKKYLDSL